MQRRALRLPAVARDSPVRERQGSSSSSTQAASEVAATEITKVSTASIAYALLQGDFEGVRVPAGALCRGLDDQPLGVLFPGHGIIQAQHLYL